MKKTDADSPPSTTALTIPGADGERADLTSGAIDYVNAGGTVAGLVAALLNPIAGAAIGGFTALGALLGARGMQKQVDAIAASARYLAQRIDEAGDRIQHKLEREEVIEIVHEAIKDTFATSYASNRRRIADVVVNGLAEDADMRTLRMFEKAAASLDDTAIELLHNLALPRPAGEFDEPQVRVFLNERRRLQDGPFGPAAVSALVLYGLVHPEEIADAIEVSSEEEMVVGVTPAMSGEIDRSPLQISATGRRFLAWVRNEANEPTESATG